MTTTFFTPTYKNERLWDWPAVIFLILALFTASRRLMSTDWTGDLGRIQIIVLAAVIAGLALGVSRFGSQTTLLFGTAYGLFAIGWQLGTAMGENILWQERLTSLANRLLFALSQLSTGRSVTDPLLFLLIIMLLFWVLAFSAGYGLVRGGRAWQAVLPTGVGLLIIHSYDALVSIRIWYLAVYLLFAMLLIGRIYFIDRRLDWQRSRTHLPLYIDVDLLRATMSIAAALLLIAFLAPVFGNSIASASAAWSEFTRPWQEFRDDFSRVFTSLRSSVGVVSDYYGESLPLGRGNSLSDQVVLTIETPRRRSATIRFYWRARVYDYYDGAQWDLTYPLAEEFDAGVTGLTMPHADSEARWATNFTVTTSIPLSMLYTASEPLLVSRPAEYQMAFDAPSAPDISSIHAEDILLPGDVYSFEAAVTAASLQELRAAGTDYPSWVTDRYLQVPDALTERTYALAREIAAGHDNPYDIADAVTRYLRQNLTYVDTVPPLPQNQELVDWVLFDSQQAFCNYYATSEIMLLRILGIPARLAVGFAEGDRSLEAEFIEEILPGDQQPIEAGEQLTSETYTVRQHDLHAWPEVYFPGIGWVEFEPTANQLPIARPESNDFASQPLTEDELASNEFDDAPQEQEDSPLDQQEDPAAAEELAAADAWWLRWLNAFIGVAVLVTAVGGWRFARARGARPIPVLMLSGLRRLNLQPPRLLTRWAHATGLPPLERAYMEINHALRRLGNPIPANATPAERADALESELPMLAESIHSLRDEYHTAAYSAADADLENARQSARIIRSTSIVARLRRLFTRIQQDEQRDDLTTAMRKLRGEQD